MFKNYFLLIFCQIDFILLSRKKSRKHDNFILLIFLEKSNPENAKMLNFQFPIKSRILK